MNKALPPFVGVDISSDHLDVAVRVGNQYSQWLASNDEPDRQATAERLAVIRPALIVVNADSGLSAPMLSELFARRLPVAPVDSRFVHCRAEEMGLVSRMDRVDGRLLACFAEVARVQPANLPENALQALSELVVQHRQAFESLNDAKYTRMKTPIGMRAALDERITQLEQEQNTLAGKIEDAARPLILAAMWSTANSLERPRQPEGRFTRRLFQLGRSPTAVLGTASRQRVRWVAAGAALLTVLGLAGFYFKAVLLPPQQPVVASTVIDLVGSANGFNEDVIHVKVGRPVTIRLTNRESAASADGNARHQWAVAELGVNLIAAPGSTNSVTFTPKRAGSFAFYCDICCGGRSNPDMDGTLIVEG